MPSTAVRAASHDVVLRDGTTVHVRPIEATDRDALLAFLEGLSPDSRAFRFMSLGVNFGQFTENAMQAHLQIVEAIEEHDAAAARTRMEEHLDCGSRLMKDMLLRGQLTGVGL